MRFFRQSECDENFLQLLREYEAYIHAAIPSNYAYPIRMRDWELTQFIGRLGQPNGQGIVLDTGCVNTFLPVWLSRYFGQVVASDLLWERIYKNLLRRMGILRRKPNEAPVYTWYRAIKHASKSIQVKTVDLTAIDYPDNHFDCITSVSVIEHIPPVEKTVAEMYRCLKPGGKLFITTDCTPEPTPYKNGCRYFSLDELRALFADYPVTSEQNEPDFSEENWCYYKDRPLVNVFIEITKPFKD